MEDLISQIEKDVLPSQRGEVYEMLCKVLNNIVEKPTEPKFRTLKKDNKKVSETLCKHPAVVCVLLAAGFEDEGATLHCPESADLEQLAEAVELLQCILASRQEEQPATRAPVATVPVATAALPPQPTAATAKAEKNPQNFARRSDLEKQRNQQAEQLQALRVAKAQAPVPPQTMEAAPEAKKPVKSAFDFENRRAKEQQRVQAEESLDDLRRRQKEKYQDFASDPNARQAEIYQQPASVARGAKVEQSWGDWFGGVFGSSSSGSGGGSRSRPSNNDRTGPNIKTVGDLPKPVQRG